MAFKSNAANLTCHCQDHLPQPLQIPSDSEKHLFTDSLPTVNLPDFAELLWTERSTAQWYSSLHVCAQTVPFSVWQHFWIRAIRVSDTQTETFLPEGQEGVSSSPAAGYKLLPIWRLTCKNIREGDEEIRYVGFFFLLYDTNILIHAEFGHKFNHCINKWSFYTCILWLSIKAL